MAGSINAIGPFYFIRLEGVPEVVRRTGIVIERAGIDGIAAVRTGIRGRPFTLRSFVDAINGQDGALAIANYQSYILSDPVELIYANQLMTNYGCFYLILDVRPLELREIAGAVGGLFLPSTAIVSAEWTLVPVAIQ